MAKKSDLAGLGMSYPLAALLGAGSDNATAQGASQASATAIGGQQYFVTVTASNSGAGLSLPTVGGAYGCLAGDEFWIVNLLSASAIVYAPTGFTLYGSGAATTGTTGVSVGTNSMSVFKVISASSVAFK